MDSYEIMNKRAIHAERSRDDANLMVETLQHKLKREETKYINFVVFSISSAKIMGDF